VGSTITHCAKEVLIRVTRTCHISVISRPISPKITIKFIYYLELHYTHIYIYWDPQLDSHSRILELFVENHRFRPYILCLSLRAPYVLPVSILFKFITYIIARMYGYSLSGHRAWNLEYKGQGGWDPGFQVERTWWLAEISVVKTKMCFNHAVPGHRNPFPIFFFGCNHIPVIDVIRNFKYSYRGRDLETRITMLH